MTVSLFLILSLFTVLIFSTLNFIRFYKLNKVFETRRKYAELREEIFQLYYDYLTMVDEELLTKKAPLVATFLSRIEENYKLFDEASIHTEFCLKMNYKKSQALESDSSIYNTVNEDFFDFMRQLDKSSKKVNTLVKRQFTVMDKMLQLTSPNLYRTIKLLSGTSAIALKVVNSFDRLCHYLDCFTNQIFVCVELLTKYKYREEFNSKRICNQ